MDGGIVEGEVVEVNLMLPPYRMTEDAPRAQHIRQVGERGWFRAKVCRVMGDGDFIWVEFGRQLTKEAPPKCAHISDYYGTYNAIYHVETVRRISVLDQFVSEI